MTNKVFICKVTGNSILIIFVTAPPNILKSLQGCMKMIWWFHLCNVTPCLLLNHLFFVHFFCIFKRRKGWPAAQWEPVATLQWQKWKTRKNEANHIFVLCYYSFVCDLPNICIHAATWNEKRLGCASRSVDTLNHERAKLYMRNRNN